jgi:hypothetical protein
MDGIGMGAIQALLNSSNRKPLDVGSGTLTASIGEDGRICSLNSYHPEHGYITLTSLEPFPNDRWYDSEWVRMYRKRIAGEVRQEGTIFGFGCIPVGIESEAVYGYKDYTSPVISWRSDEICISACYDAVDDPETPYIRQTLSITNHSERDQQLTFDIGGRFSLNRCSYGQLTEGGPILLPEQMNALQVRENHISISNKNLDARADIYLYANGNPLMITPHRASSAEPIDYADRIQIDVPAGETGRLELQYTLSAGYGDIRVLPAATAESPSFAEHREIRETHDTFEFIIRRNLDYILSCCAVPVGDERYCVLTDHQLLPLSWNRDAYYMMRLLIEAAAHEGYLHDAEKLRIWRIVKGHLLWMFELANRPNGYWGRAYLTNGHCKDNVFQLDQQCYPLLELCDYYEFTRDEDTVSKLLPEAAKIVAMLTEHKAREQWLFLTGETPADDKVDYPYHFSSQVLVWHTLKRLAHLNEAMPVTDSDLWDWAERVRKDCLLHFTTLHRGKPIYAYLTDLKGNVKNYHDANDLPTVYAPLWGFCQKEDEAWRNTMQFAFSADNAGGYYEGEFGGLGSVHTPHPWPLGAAQELIWADALNDEARSRRVMEQLIKIVQWDGLFSEAVDEHTGKVMSRHWFSWPGAVLSYEMLKTRSAALRGTGQQSLARQ